MAITTGRHLIVLDPTAEIEAEPAARATRTGSLRGKTVGLVDNSKTNAGRFLELLAEELQARYGVAGTVTVRKPGASRVVPEPMADELAAKADLVIAAIGD